MPAGARVFARIIAREAIQMRQMQKVLWSKGVLLTPQHLQLQDRFHEDSLSFLLSSLAFLPWGLSRVDFDRDALSGGSFVLASAAGIFPDGLAFDVPAADAAPPPKPIEDKWHPDQRSMLVYLAIPEDRPGGHNVGTGSASRAARYVAEVVMRRDENSGLAEKPIQVARKNLRLLVEGEALEGHITLPVARVIRTAAGTFELDAAYVPPLINISASEHLMGIARRLIELLSARSSSLSSSRRQRSRGLADFGIADVANFWLLYTVNTHLPGIRHVFETRQGHPAELFAAMLALGGALTTFSTSIHPRNLPEYDHANLSECFDKLDVMLRELLETVVPANHVSLPLRRTEPSVYATAIDQDRYLSATRMYLAVAADAKPEEIARRVPQLVKVSSADQIDRLIKRALPGLSLTHAPNPPSALPVRLDYQYFALETAGADWDAIRMARNLAVYAPSDLPNPRLELIILFPAAGSA